MSSTETFIASRAMQALEVLAFGPATTTTVAAELQVHPRTARRLLNRLVSDGWLVRRDGRRPTYTPTLRIVALASQLAERTPLVRHAADLACVLQRETAAAVHLAIPSYRSTLRLLRVCGRDMSPRVLCDLAPANATAAGKTLLAFRGPWREALLAGPLAAPTERTVADADALAQEVARVRERGYAIEDGELHPGIRAIALPVRAEDDDVVAALAISSAQAPLAALLDRRDAVADVAARLSHRLREGAA